MQIRPLDVLDNDRRVHVLRELLQEEEEGDARLLQPAHPELLSQDLHEVFSLLLPLLALLDGDEGA